MGPRASSAEGHCAWPLVRSSPILVRSSSYDHRPRCDEPSTQAPVPACGAAPQTPKPVPLEPPKRLNDNAPPEVEASVGSRDREDEAPRTGDETRARGRDSNHNGTAEKKHVSGQRLTHDGSCKIDVPEHRKPLLGREDESGKVTDCSILKSRLSEMLWRVLEAIQIVAAIQRAEAIRKASRIELQRSIDTFARFSEAMQRRLEALERYFAKFFCDLWEPRSCFTKIRGGGMKENATGDSGLESLSGKFPQRSTFRDQTHAKSVSLSRKAPTEANVPRRSRGGSSQGDGAFTALNFFIKDGLWQCRGYDVHSGKWQTLSKKFSCLPNPDPNLFMQYSICGHGGLMLANISKSPHQEELVVFNISTGKVKALPPLRYTRTPVLLHIWVDSASGSYKVIAAGSACNAGEKDLSRRIEVYDSRTSIWKTGSYIPGPEFGLNERQAGVCVNGVLYFLAFLEGGDGRRGIVAFDIEKGEWLKDRTCEVPFSSVCNTLQLLESFGKLYLFSEQERDGVVEHCIDVVALDAGSELRTVVRVPVAGGRGLVVYPEYTCVPFGEGRLCVFNTITRDGVVYDIEKETQSEVLQPPPENRVEENFFSLNPVSFTLTPNSTSKP